MGYQVVGRHIPRPFELNPTLFRMRIWATDVVRARSKFWYFLRKLHKIKKSNGQIITCNLIHEKNTNKVKNYGIWLRYQSRTGYHNAYKECRDTTMNGAVEQMFLSMASRHRVNSHSIQIIRTAVIPPGRCRREATKQFHDKNIKFPLTRRILRPSCKKYKTLFKGSRPNLAMRN